MQRCKISDLKSKCADINYLRGSVRPFEKDVGNYFIDNSLSVGFSVCEVINSRGGIHRVQYGMTAGECMMFLLGMEYAEEARKEAAKHDLYGFPE